MLLDHIIPASELSEYIRMYRIADFVFTNTIEIHIKPYPPRPQECLQFYPCDPEVVSYDESTPSFTSKSAVITGQHTVVTNRIVVKILSPFKLYSNPEHYTVSPAFLL